MTTPTSSSSLPQLSLAHVGMAAVVCGTIVGVLFAIPDSQNPYTVLVLVLGFFGQALSTLSNRRRLADADRKLDRVLNGEMQGKLEAAVHTVLDARQREDGQVPHERTDPRDDGRAES